MSYPYGGGGYGQQQAQPNYAFLQSQPTGFIPQSHLQAQRTGFPPQPQFAQPTGYPQQGVLRPPLPLQGQPTGFPLQQSFQQPQRTGFPSNLTPQATGFPGGGYGGGQMQQPQFAPALQSAFLQTFLPAPQIQPSPYMNPAQMQFQTQAPPGQLQQVFQQQNQAATGQANVAIPWALSADEKKRYDQIFRAWDQSGQGFINGNVAQEVFGQAGLDRDDLMAIWNLADVEDRGKLNIDEFHVAMGLIYRRLNGNPIPATLPPELAPPSSRDLSDSVGFLKSLLKNDTHSRATSGSPEPHSYAKSRTLHGGPEAGRKDATVYRHNDEDESRGTYKSSARHLNREDVRPAGRSDTPDDELEEVKKSFKKSSSILERSRRDEEDEDEARGELRALKRTIKRINEDLEDLEDSQKGGRRSAAKEEERRKLERQLLKLEHEDLPNIERKLKDIEIEKKRAKGRMVEDRDRRNSKYEGKYDDRDSYDRDRRDRDRDVDRGYNRGSYDRSDDDTPPPTRSRDRRYRDESPPPSSRSRARSPPPAPKPAPPPPAPVVAAPSPAPSPAPATASMTPAERQAHIRAEAQKRLQDRMRALGVAAPSGDAVPDTSVADRLAQEAEEARRKAEEADRLLAEKEKERQAKLERERGRGVEIEKAIQEAPAAPAPAPAVAKADPAPRAAAPAGKVPPPPPPSRARVPPPPRANVAPAPAPPKPAYDDDDFAPRAPKVVAAPVVPAVAAPPPPPPPPAPVAPPAPAPALAVPAATSSPLKSPSTNPFHRLGSAVTTPSPAAVASVPKTNPFFAAPPSPAPPPAPTPPVQSAPVPAAAPVKATYRPPPPPDDDWDSPAALEKDVGSDSSDDEDFGDRFKRQALAKNLFGQIGIAAPVRPPSAQAATPPPPAPPAPPAAPPAPRAPVPSASSDEPIVPAPRPMGLLGEIGAGVRLKKTQTVDKSGPAVAGAVIGDPSPPVQVFVPPPSPPSAPPPPPAPPAPPALEANGDAATNDYLTNRQSVDWYGGLASATVATPAVPSTLEVQHEEEPTDEPTPAPPADVAEEDPLAAVDMTKTFRSLALYTYEGQRAEDLSFVENAILLVNASKDPAGDWWYGKIEATGATGWLPKSYVEEIKVKEMKALYAYVAGSDGELSFDEDEVVAIVDTSDADWWKAEKGGVVGVVPASYFEPIALVLDSHPGLNSVVIPPSPVSSPHHPSPVSPSTIQADEGDDNSDSSYDSDDSDDSDVESPTARSPSEREAERLRVLEAAGLLVRTSASESSPVKRRATRRAAPARPIKRPVTSTTEVANEEVPDEEEREETSPEQQQERIEDAYDLYQRAMRDLPPLPDDQRSPDNSQSLELSPTPSHISPPPSPAFSQAPSISSTHRSAASSFLSRVVTGMSRNSTSATGDRPKLVVSAPITSPVIESAPGDRSSGHYGAVGSSWASLIDQSALDNVPDRERKRQEAIFEFITTEQTYLKSLQLIIEVFFSALQPILDEKASQIIFANIEDILLFNTVFLSELEERQRVSRLYVDQIGDVIKTHIRGLDIYRPYCVNQRNAASTLADLKASDPVLRSTLNRIRVKNLELEHFLLEPMQRLTRYPLLIHQILRYTEPDHPDYASLSASHSVSESILSGVNEAVRSHENEAKLAELSQNLEFAGVDARLDLTAPTRLMGRRKILKEGQVTKAKSGRKLNTYLFNDLLLFTELRQGGYEVVYRWPIPLDESSVRSDRRDDSGFQVTYRGETIHVRAPTPRQCMAWEKEIGSARTACLEAYDRRRKSRG